MTVLLPVSIVFEVDQAFLLELGEEVEDVEVIERIVVAVATEDEEAEADDHGCVAVSRSGTIARELCLHLRLLGAAL